MPSILTCTTRLPALLLALVLVATAVAYGPALSGPFLLDDFGNLDKLGDVGGIRDLRSFEGFAAGGISGPTGRPLSLLSFLIDDVNWPSDPGPFKTTNLKLHLLVGVVVVWFVFRLLAQSSTVKPRDAWVAVIAGGAWMLHPFLVSTTMYVVQRMTILSAFFTVVGLLFYIIGRARIDNRSLRGYLVMSVGIGICTPLAVFSKENGVLLPLLILITEHTVVQYLWRHPAPLNLWFERIALWMPVVLLISYLFVRPFLFGDGYANAYLWRPFDLGERLFAESFIALKYLSYLFIPRFVYPGLLAENSFFVDDAYINLVTVSSSIVVVLLVAFSLIVRKKFPLISFAVLFFFAGHLLESTVVPLELYFEHRNYLPATMLFVFPVWYLTAVRSMPVVRVLLSTILLVGLGVLTLARASLWSSPTKLYSIWSGENPYSVRAQRFAALEYERQGRQEEALLILETAAKRITDNLDVQLDYLIHKCRISTVLPRDVRELFRRVENYQYDFRTLGLVQLFVMSGRKPECRGITEQDGVDLLVALDRNPGARMRPGYRRELVYLRGILEVERGRPQLAVDRFEEALKIHMHLETGLHAVGYLAGKGYPVDALKLLEYIEGRVRDGASTEHRFLDFEHEIRQLREKLTDDLSRMDKQR